MTGSPLYASVCRRLADAPVVRAVAPDDRWDIPLRLLAGLHYLALSEGLDPWGDPVESVAAHADALARFAAEQSIQTNEVQRSWMLLPCFLDVVRRSSPQMLDLVELGPSAGLNLVWDRYRYRYAHGLWGPADATLELSGEERRAVPPSVLGRSTHVRRRVGIDLRPIDVRSEEGARLLRCFVWADQADRLDRLDRAIAELRRDPPELIRGDLVTVLPDVLAERDEGALTVVFETAVLGYVTPDERETVFATLDRAGRDGPLAFVRTSQPPDGTHTHYGLSVRFWPADPVVVALANVHGAWLEWIAS